jgi:hypothetical protein
MAPEASRRPGGQQRATQTSRWIPARQALLSVGVPRDDRFQVISEHDAANFIFHANYLGVRRSDDRSSRSPGTRAARSSRGRRSTRAGKLSLRREDVFINLVEVRRENWSFGNGVAQYAT